MNGGSLAVIAAIATGIATAALTGMIVKPTPRLAPRVRPYVTPSRTSLGRAPDVSRSAHRSASAVQEVFGPMVRGVAKRLGRIVDSAGDEATTLRLRQAGYLDTTDPPDRLAAYRMRQLGSAAGFTAGAGAAAVLVGLPALGLLLCASLGFVFGVTRWKGKVDAAIESRRQRMQIEIYTINQLLALDVRSGAGVIQATRHLTDRGRGAVVDELREALRLHRSGVPAGAAFRRIAAQTPEPQCARTYAVLAAADERGADLADALLTLSEDVREHRRQAMKRRATRRRAAMLVPTIAILAPIMLLFVAAPLPQIIFGIR